MAANPSISPSSSSSSTSSLHRSFFTRSLSSSLFRTSLKLGFSSSETPRILSVRSGLGASSMASNGDGFRSNSGEHQINTSTTAPSSSSTSSSAIDFLTLCNRLKYESSFKDYSDELFMEYQTRCFGRFWMPTTKRKGWINHGIKGPESIADHMYRMAIMALIAGDLPGVNRERCIKIAIVHDIAEAIVGDITPADGVPKQEKNRREQAALNEMCEVLGGGLRAEEIQELWAEYENNSSIEANLVKDFDKVEMILQALEYEMDHGKVLDEFFISTAGKFQTEIGKSWAAEIISRRKLRSGQNLE